MINQLDEVFSILPSFQLDPSENVGYYLTINCSKCNIYCTNKIPNKRYSESPECIACLIYGLDIFSKNRITGINFGSDYLINHDDYEKFQHIYCCYKLFLKFNNKKKSCKHFKGRCPIIQRESFKPFDSSLNFVNYLFFESIENKFTPTITGIPKKLYCHICIQKIKGYIKQLQKIINKTLNYLNLDEIKKRFDNKLQIIASVFYNSHDFSFNDFNPVCHDDIKKKIEIDKYNLVNFPFYEVRIHKIPMDPEYQYSFTTRYGQKPIILYENISNSVINELKSIKIDNFIPIEQAIDFFRNYAENSLKLHYQSLSDEEILSISILITVKLMKISKIFPLLVDDCIEEIYYDRPNGFIYLDHQKFGRCTTSIQFNETECQSIKTMIRIMSKKRLDYSNPSVITTIRNQYFFCRFAIDISPIALDGFCMDIRKMNKKIYSLPELIELKTLDLNIAAFLIFCVFNRINITVVGETGSGKTTLINALDLFVPKCYRKIYVEETPESVNQISYNFHQLNYLVDPDNEQQKVTSKSREINKLLHRNPDVVYLGEILNKEESHAMFQCLSAGLRGFQTIHAKDLDGLINRWSYHYQINPSCFNDLGIIIILGKFNQTRIISEIYEISFDNEIKRSKIFHFDSNNEQWVQDLNTKQLKVLSKLLYNKLIYKNMDNILLHFMKLINNFVESKNFGIFDQIKSFNNLFFNIIQKGIINLDEEIDKSINSFPEGIRGVTLDG